MLFLWAHSGSCKLASGSSGGCDFMASARSSDSSEIERRRPAEEEEIRSVAHKISNAVAQAYAELGLPVHTVLTHVPQNYQYLTDLLIRVDPLTPAQSYNPNTLIINSEEAQADNVEATSWEVEESDDEEAEARREEERRALRASGSSSDFVSTDALRAVPRGPWHLGEPGTTATPKPKTNRKLEPQLLHSRVTATPK
eukprot:s2644_g5.t1